MIFHFKNPLTYKTSYGKLNQSQITVNFLTIKHIIFDPLVKTISVLFFEAPSSLVLFEKEEYILNLNKNKIISKIEEIIKNDSDFLLKSIYDIDFDKLKKDNQISMLEVQKLKTLKSHDIINEETSVNINDIDIKMVSEQVETERYNICKGCEFFDSQALKGSGMCEVCACPVAYKIKQAKSFCPKDKWNSL